MDIERIIYPILYFGYLDYFQVFGIINNAPIYIIAVASLLMSLITSLVEILRSKITGSKILLSF